MVMGINPIDFNVFRSNLFSLQVKPSLEISEKAYMITFLLLTVLISLNLPTYATSRYQTIMNSSLVLCFLAEFHM